MNYTKSNTNVKIGCYKHGVFEQQPSNHLKGNGCHRCDVENRTKSKEKFINEAKLVHGDKYDYSKVNYVNSFNKIKILCPEHGEFEQQPNNHLVGKGCVLCGKIKSGNKQIKSKEDFINNANLIHDNVYNYSNVEYTGAFEKVKIVCSKHGIFEQIPNSHLRGGGCPKCALKYNKNEGELKEFIKSLGVVVSGNTKNIIKPHELDVYIPSHNLAIEFDGLYWHSELYRDKNYHLNKTLQCEKQGIRLIHIFEDEWLNKQDIVKSRLKNILGLTKDKLYARKCEIKEISSQESRVFLDTNHLQGNVNSSIRLGLFYDNELVSLMTFGSLRKSMGQKPLDGSYELLRFCNKLDTSVIGGADRLLKYFIKTYQPKEIISYADRRWSQGGLYNKLGFEFIHDSEPNYFYIIGKTREHRFKYRKDVLIKEGFDKNNTERQIMLDREIHRIYDCGTKKYSKIIN